MMEYTMQERAERIVAACMEIEDQDPMKVFRKIVAKEFVRMHGPEHHVVDGACILTAYRNAGGKIDLEQALKQLMAEGLRMPGATCRLWGVCGSAPSIGAALAIIDGTGAMDADKAWGARMAYTSAVLKRLGEIGGPRCCKRHAFVAITEAIRHINANYGMNMPMPEIRCGYFVKNEQCIGNKCPYYPV